MPPHGSRNWLSVRERFVGCQSKKALQQEPGFGLKPGHNAGILGYIQDASQGGRI